jgi:hypothetical protein
MFHPSVGLDDHSQGYLHNDTAPRGITSPYHYYILATSFGYQHPNQQLPQHQTMEFHNHGSSHTSSPYALGQPSAKQIKRPKQQMTSNTLAVQRNSPVRIQPHPDGLQRLERERREGQKIRPHRNLKGLARRHPKAEEEDAFVEELRAECFSWKIVAEKFREQYGKDTSVERLQMRMTRRKGAARGR